MYDGKDKDMYLDTSKRQRTVFTDDVLVEAKNVFVDLAVILDEVISGEETMSSACNKRGYDYLSVRKLMMTSGFKNIKLDSPAMDLDDALDRKFNGYERLYNAIFGDKTMYTKLPLDYIETIEYQIKDKLNEQQTAVIRHRFGIDGTETPNTLEDVANMMGIQRERVRQLEGQALRTLRHPSSSRMLRKGKKQFEVDKAAYDKALKEYREAQLTISEEMAEQIKKLNGTAVCAFDESIEILDLSVRAYHCLTRYGIKTIGDLAHKSVEDMMKVRNLGRRSYEELVGKCLSFEGDRGIKMFSFLHESDENLYGQFHEQEMEELLKELE